MILQRLSAVAISKLFGDGLGADLAGRGAVFLASATRQAIDRDDEQITRVRLRPGERYTVIARPPATRRERRLATSQKALVQRYEHLSRPTRSQIRAAKRLARSQRKLDRTSPNSRRRATREQVELRRGRRFDQRLRPSKKLLKVSAALSSTSHELAESRAEQFERARSGTRRWSRRERVTVYD